MKVDMVSVLLPCSVCSKPVELLFDGVCQRCMRIASNGAMMLPRARLEPSPTECTPGAPRKDADYHDGTVQVSKSPERYRCADCGREWEP